MKKLVTLMLLTFPFVAWGVDIPPTVDDAVDQKYHLNIGIEGGINGVQSVAKTMQELDGISYAVYTVSYTVMVDAIREIITKAWVADSAGLPEAQVQAILADPKSFICQ